MTVITPLPHHPTCPSSHTLTPAQTEQEQTDRPYLGTGPITFQIPGVALPAPCPVALPMADCPMLQTWLGPRIVTLPPGLFTFDYPSLLQLSPPQTPPTDLTCRR